jgi:hypothetical protein
MKKPKNSYDNDSRNDGKHSRNSSDQLNKEGFTEVGSVSVYCVYLHLFKNK